MLMFDVKELIADLQAINAKSAEYAGLEKKRARMEKDLAAVEKELDRANKELESAEAQLSKLQAKNQHDYDVAIQETRAKLEKAWIAEEAANRELGNVNAKLRDARALESGLVAAISALQARLSGRPEDDIIGRLSSGTMHE